MPCAHHRRLDATAPDCERAAAAFIVLTGAFAAHKLLVDEVTTAYLRSTL